MSSIYKISWATHAKKELFKLEKNIQIKIISSLENKLINNPRKFGKRLHGDWSYRLGNYRIIYNINDEKICILVVSVGHRKDIYRSFQVHSLDKEK